MKQLLDYADILLEAPCYLGYLWIADKFCKKYLKISKKNELLFVIFSFISWLVLNLWNRCYSVPYIFPIMFSHIFFVGLVLLLFQEKMEKKILAASILMIVLTLVGNFCISFLSCLVLVFKHIVKGISEPFLEEWETGLIGYASFCLVILTLYWMFIHLESVFCDKTEKWYATAVIPLLMIIAIIDVVNWGASNGIMVRSGDNMGLYYDQIFSHAEICVLTSLSMFAAGGYVFGMEQIYLEQKKSSQYQSQIAVYKMLGEQYRQSERLRHDMKNHIIALSGLFKSKEWDKLGNYLKNMESSGIEAYKDITGNKVVDALLYQKWILAKRDNIKWECNVHMPKVLEINEFDLCVLFGNLLDNALEGCERLQCSDTHCGGCCFINIQAEIVKKCFLLEVKNSMDIVGSYANDFKNGKTKAYGTGLQNVNDMVHRYNGIMNIEAQNGIFVISILIPLNDAVHDIKQVV